MALMDHEGFDEYNNPFVDMTAKRGFIQWQLPGPNDPTVSFVPGLVNGQGKALSYTFTSTFNAPLTATFAAANSQAYFSVRMKLPTVDFGSGSGMYVEVVDSMGGAQITLHFNQSNYGVQVYLGSFTSSTLIGSSANNVWAANAPFFADFYVDINSSTGAVGLQLNNVQVLNLTGVNTQSTANATFDSVVMLPSPWGTAVESTFIIDDFRYNDTTSGPGPNPYNGYMGDMRTVTSFVIGNDIVQLTPLITTGTIGSTTTGGTVTDPANQIVFAPFLAPFSGTMGTSVTVDLNAGATGHVVLGVYDSDGPNGRPFTLLGQSSPVTNPTSGNNTFTFGSGLVVNTNRTYYWALQGDAAVTPQCGPGTATTWITGYASAYTGTMPATVTFTGVPTTLGAGVATISGTLSLSNAGNVSETAMDSDASYNYGSTVGNQDLLNAQQLPPLIINIAAVTVTTAAEKDEAGTRAFENTIGVGGTQYYGTDHYLGTGYNYYSDLWVLNPNTSLPWTSTQVNGVNIGYKVSV